MRRAATSALTTGGTRACMPRRPLTILVVGVVLAIAACESPTASNLSPMASDGPDAGTSGVMTGGPPTAVPFPSADQPGLPDPVPALPLRAAFPPAMSIAAGRTLLTLWESDDISGTHRVLTLYGDGSILVPWAAEVGGPAVRRLSAQGLGHLRERLSATGAFDRSRSFPPAPGWAGGFAGYDFDYAAGDAPIRVSATNASSDPLARRLMTLGDAMRNLPVLLPAATEWTDRDPSAHPFEPASAIITVQWAAAGDVLLDLPDERIDVLAPLLPGPVDSLGIEVTAPDGSRRARCAVVDGRAALAVQQEAARRFDVMETGLLIDSIPPADHPIVGGVDLRSPDGGAIVRTAWRPARPGETLRCDGTALPVAPNPARYLARGAEMVLRSAGGIGGDTALAIRLTAQVTPDLPDSGQVTVLYLDDGTVVTHPPRAPLAGLGLRRQSDAGVRQLDAMVAAADLPDTERHVEAPLDQPGRMYSLIFPDGRVVEAAEREPNLEAHRIVELVRRLVAPDVTFPAAAWRDPRPLPYSPDEVAVRTMISEASVVPRATLSMITPAFDPATFGEPETAAPEIRCRVLAIDDAVALARSFRAVTRANGDAFRFATGTPRQIVEVAFEMRGPMDTPPACD